LERIGNAEKKFERKVEKKVMENKNLVIAIGVVFVLVIIIGGYVLFNGEDKVPESSSTVSSLVTTCDDWCANEQLSDWCDFELSADTGRGSCYGFANSPLYTQLGVKKCSAIDCNNRPVEDNTCMEGLGGVWDTSNSNGECDPVNGITRFVVTSTDEPPVAGQVCCVE
ncbi:MAG: hypothetical protein KJ879_01655, partial [Nanoarchaeota archaeon]|nr:hypothetical protein [Nanoarchaeota archaeon]